MPTIRISVTAEHIEAAGPPPGEEAVLEVVNHDPVERAIADRTGQAVMCDQDDDTTELATIGQGDTTLVVKLPPEQKLWIDRWYAGKPVEPFEFDFELDDWLVTLALDAAGR